MQKIFYKVWTILIVLLLIGINVVPVISYASSENIPSQKNNVEVDVKINGSYDTKADINSEATMEISADLKSTGYLKDINIVVSNNNYDLEKINDERVNFVSDNEMRINELEIGQNLNLKIPVKFNKEDSSNVDSFIKESMVGFNAIFVNEEGKEEKIERKLNLRLEWVVDSVEEISQSLTRYLKYDNKTLVSFEINEGIKDNAIPVKNKNISIIPPKIKGKNPTKAILSSENNNFSYTYENGVLNIKEQLEENDGKYNWNSQSKYNVTYIYEEQDDNNIITTSGKSTVNTIKEVVLEGSTKENQFEVQGNIGNIIQLSMSNNEHINKGYMHTSNKKGDNLNTNYNAKYTVDVGYADIIDTITVAEDYTNFTDDNNNSIKNVTDMIQNNKVSVEGSKLVDILGENGNIYIKDENNNELGSLNKDNTQISISAGKIVFELTKPVKEGEIVLDVEKSIIGSANSSKEEIDSYKKIISNIQCIGYKDSSEISRTSVSSEAILDEAISKADMSISTDRLSTVVNNENVIFNVILNKSNISDLLYTNPTIKLKLPEEVTEININSAKILYEEEMNSGNIEVNGSEISVGLVGNQTTYANSEITDGTLIRLETNLKLNNLATSTEKNVVLEYSNQYSGETYSISKPISIVAPSGFITTNSVNVDGKSKTAIEDNQEPIKVNAEDSAKTMEISANLVNNLGYDANGLNILGRIPTAGNKTPSGIDLQTNINSVLSSTIQTTGLDDAVIYYSDNIDENANSPFWSTEATQNTKSFKIVKSTPFNDKQTASFKYLVTIPQNLGYDKQAVENYAIYYDNNAQEGVTTNVIESKSVGITTGKAPALKLELSAFDTNEGYEIKNNGNVTKGEYVTYNAKITNTGSEDAHNVSLKSILPEYTDSVTFKPGSSQMLSEFVTNSDKNVEKTFELIKAGEQVEYQIPVKISRFLSKKNQTIEFNMAMTADILQSPVSSKYTLIGSDGTISAKLSSYLQGEVKLNEQYKYHLQIENTNNLEKNNVEAKIQLPKGIVYQKIYGVMTSDVDANYDQNSNILYIKAGNLKGFESKSIIIYVMNSTNENNRLKTQAIINYSGSNKEIKTNVFEQFKENTNDVIKATQSVNVANDITDEDNVEFYIDIENKSIKEQSVFVKDQIQNDLSVDRYVVTIDDSVLLEGNSSFINESLTIPSGKKARITIYAKPYKKSENENVKIENNPSIINYNDETISVNSISFNISGTKKEPKEVSKDEGINNRNETIDLEQNNQEKTYRLSGKIWFDSNKNGSKESEESFIPNIRLKLFDNIKKEIVKENNVDIEITSNENGEYTFSNIPVGEYVVIAMFDNQVYEITKYKVDGTDESANSDFVYAKYDEKDVGVTDVLKLVDKNIYSLNLGLVEKEKFSLNITNNITKVTSVGKNMETKEYYYDTNSENMELATQDVENSTLLIEYSVNVSNIGNVDGYAKMVANYLPKGLSFNAELNKDWYLSKDGKLYTVSLANDKIEPGETKTLKLVLTKNVTEGETGLIREKSEIQTTYNEKGLENIDAQSYRTVGNSSSNLVILKRPNLSIITMLSISLAFIIAIVTLGYGMKKRIDKKYSIEKNDL